MATRAPQLIQHYVTRADRGLREWHLLLRRATFGAALVLMLASIVSLHWACVLIGLPDHLYAPIAWVVPLAMEVGMASVASAATTIRKEPKPGREVGGYFLSLWAIFSFIMLLAQAANIGHAMTVVETTLGAAHLPPFIPTGVVYVFAGAFAALFPLGGTLLVHVSGFLREHGRGAKWIEEGAETVQIEAAPGLVAAPAARAPRATESARTPIPTRAPTARTAATAARDESSATRDAQPATATAARAPEPAPEARDARVDEAREALFVEYRDRLATGDRMQGGEIAERLGINAGYARNLRKAWDGRLNSEGALTATTQAGPARTVTPEAELEAAVPEKDPIVEQVQADVDITKGAAQDEKTPEPAVA